ncbi:MAG: hypothetical protein EA397_15835 [Deltaproteobacteria bacterium]|nr:MAG: hypothetical protein EA397_15835 [Deltaproteobacteria bacterium]
MRGTLLLLLLSCTPREPATCEGERLFGTPNAATGLGEDQCRPTCSCDSDPWSPPDYPASEIAAWRDWSLDEPFTPPSSDPYADPDPFPPEGPDTVCAVVPTGERSYRLQTYDSTQQARRDGGRPTHFGTCGLCSTLVDLAVYADTPDLTEPVRTCGLDHLTGPAQAHVACLTDLGFTEPCAWIWYYNTLHTRRHCAAPCFASLDHPYHLPDGELNECLRCDEVESGPVFKAIAGRTRRNTGLPSSMCRPCDEVRPLIHDYR